MKKAFDVIAKFFNRTFCIFTFIVIAVCIFGMIFEVVDLSSYLIFSFLGFSAMLGLSFLIGDFFKNSSVLRNAVKFILSYVSLVIAFFLGGPLSSYVASNNVSNKSFTILAISLAFVLIYALVGLVVLLVGFITRKVNNSKKDYESMFSNN